MKEATNKILESDKRAVVDDLLLRGMHPRRIALYMREMYGVIFPESSVADYRDNHFRNENGIVFQVVKAAQDLVDKDPPPTSDREALASYFTLRHTKSDLELIYDRIRKMRELAEKYPFDESYDKRIVNYLAQAEDIRTRVFRHQYEQIRKAVLLNVGKKICMAAINIFLPYIPSDRRKEAVSKFEVIIKPMLGLTSVPDEPADIRDIREKSMPVDPGPDPGIKDPPEDEHKEQI